LADEKAAPAVQNPLSMCQGPSGFIFILAFGFLMLIMFDKNLGDAISGVVGIVFMPLIGFGGKVPLLTMTMAGLLTIAISTTVRHFMMDWVDLARKQRTMNEYNKAVREATKSGNQSRLEKLQSGNQDIMGMQSAMMMQQMKSSVISMVVAILIFRWLYSFIWSIPQPTITMPWEMTWNLTDSAFGDVCGAICFNPRGGGIPYWIFAYIPITVPIGQALMRGLKYYEFSRKLKSKGEDTFGKQAPKEGKKEKGKPPEKKLERKGKDRKKKADD